MAKIAIVGGGIFGGSAAVSLATAGHLVTVFEKNRRLLDGTTLASTNRLHLGFHYPRDRPTALQSKLGSVDFLARFPGAVSQDFPNYYGLVRHNSKSSLSAFESFVQDLALPCAKVELPEALSLLGLSDDDLAGLWAASEGSISVEIVRKILVRQLAAAGVKVRLGSSVGKIQKKNTLWRVSHTQGIDDFDVVVKATYGADQIECDSSIVATPRVFELTVNLEIVGPPARFGLTLIDGDFLTVLPKGFSNSLLVYAPGPSVIRRTEGLRPENGFSVASASELDRAEDLIVERLSAWLPGLASPQVLDRLVGVRTLLPGTRLTDARESSVRELGRNFYEIFAGKIDHAVSVAGEITRQISA